MKTCLICQAKADDAAATCVACGEGSFALAVTVTPKVTPPEPPKAQEPSPEPEAEKPARRGARR